MQPIQQNVVWCRRRVRRCGAPAHPRTAADTLLAAVMATAGQHRHDACSTTDLTRAGRWRVQGRPDDTTCMQQHGSATPCTAVASTAGQRPDSACAALHGNSHHTRQRSQHSLCSIIALPKEQDVLLHLPVPLAVQDLRHAGPQLATAAAQQRAGAGQAVQVSDSTRPLKLKAAGPHCITSRRLHSQSCLSTRARLTGQRHCSPSLQCPAQACICLRRLHHCSR